jgi:hypothetical protein
MRRRRSGVGDGIALRLRRGVDVWNLRGVFLPG